MTHSDVVEQLGGAPASPSEFSPSTSLALSGVPPAVAPRLTPPHYSHVAVTALPRAPLPPPHAFPPHLCTLPSFLCYPSLCLCSDPPPHQVILAAPPSGDRHGPGVPPRRDRPQPCHGRFDRCLLPPHYRRVPGASPPRDVGPHLPGHGSQRHQCRSGAHLGRAVAVIHRGAADMLCAARVGA